jgi:two-component system, cell cycle response regulator CpdR
MARILIVEDDLFFAAALARVLELAGHEVTAAEGAADGIRRGAMDRPDVVIAAWHLKGDVHGGEVCRRIHAAWPGVKAIVVTAHQEHAFEAARCCWCVEGVLVKPFHKSEILDAVRRATADATDFAVGHLPIAPFSEQDDSYQLQTQR